MGRGSVAPWAWWSASRPAGLSPGWWAGSSPASFYLLAPMLRYTAMFVAWCFLWIIFSYLDGPLLRGRPRAEALARGAVAALASGIAFYAVAGMWTRWDPATISYLDHFWRWSVAFLPGFLALRWPVGGRG
jgi:hypothetical protein